MLKSSTSARRLTGCLALALVAIFLAIFLGAVVSIHEARAADAPAIATILNAPPKAAIGTKSSCAVCGMKLTVLPSTPTVSYKGKDYYFCDPSERAEFMASPDKYVHK